MHRMQRTRAGLVALVALAAALLSSCAGAVSDAYVVKNDPGSVEPIEGTHLSRVMITAEASQRLGIETERVTGSARGLVVPPEAVFVDPDGAWWVYTVPGPNEYVRHEVVVKYQAGDEVFLSKGPAPGTQVVTVGVAEVYGVEFEVGH